MFFFFIYLINFQDAKLVIDFEIDILFLVKYSNL